MGQIDFLTGFLSKEAMDATLDKIKAECDVDRRPFSVLVLDLDHFKTYNDKYGHLDGDDVLRYFSSTLRISLDSSSVPIFRFGGDEFIVVFPGKNAKETYHITREILNIIKKRPFLSRGRMYKLSFSAGVASYPSDGRDIEGIIQKADKAMYFSKDHNRGSVTIFGNIVHKRIERAMMIIVIILCITGALVYLNHSAYKDSFVTWLKEKSGRIVSVLTHAKTDMSGPDMVYLRSGRILKGTIMREDKDEIELGLGLDTGMGTVTIKRSDIDRVSNYK